MAAAEPKTRLTMECLKGVWEPLEDDMKCQYKGTVKFMMSSLEHPELQDKVFETRIKWI